MGFGSEKDSSHISGIDVLVADEAVGVERDRFAGIVGLAPSSTERKLPSFLGQMQQIKSFA